MGVFFGIGVVQGLYTAYMPTRKPPQAYPPGKGACASTSHLAGAYADTHEGKCSVLVAKFNFQCKCGTRNTLWQLRLQDRVCSTSENLCKGLAARKGRRIQNAFKACATPTGPARRL